MGLQQIFQKQILFMGKFGGSGTGFKITLKICLLNVFEIRPKILEQNFKPINLMAKQ